jgi:hypothetical protein
MSVIRLRVPCYVCDRRGCYIYSQPVPIPCWACEGKGWRSTTMTAPDPKWARQYQRERRRDIKTSAAEREG